MEKIWLINGSPRPPRSNSRLYAHIFEKYCHMPYQYIEINKNNTLELCEQIKDATEILLIFPLYADSLPVPLLTFLKVLATHLPENRPTISVLINCGFLEPRQNDIAVEMIHLFCDQHDFPFGSVLKIGSGEAILQTPFKFLVNRKIKKLAVSIQRKQNQTFQVTMPLSKKMFIKASDVYWENYGKKNGVTKQEMQSMQIEQK